MNSKSICVVLKSSKVNDENKIIITVPIFLLKSSFDISCNNFLGKLKVGMKELYVKFIPCMSDTLITMPEPLMSSLGLFDGFECNAQIENKILSLGPVVGIFTSKNYVKKACKQVTTNKMAHYIQANKIARNIMYFFSINDIDFINHQINGTIYNEKLLQWEKRKFPFPDVLYDRGGSQSKKYKIVSKYIRRQFRKIIFLKKINPIYYFDKLETYKKLSSYEEILPYLPYTIKYSKEADLRDMFKRSKTLYIKDRTGSNGRGIMKVEKKSENLYAYSTSKKVITKKTSLSFDDLIKALENFFNKKNLIIQTAIDLIKIDSTIVDMRATLQRNKKGELVIVTYAVRVAKPKSPVTSTASGACVYPFDKFFKDKMGNTDEQILEKRKLIESFLIKIYTYIEKIYGTFGEIGIDFAMDKNGQLWFIESNAKPAKTTIHKLKDKELLLSAYLNPLEYAKYLMHF